MKSNTEEIPMFTKAEFKEVYADFQTKEGRDEAIQWFLFHWEHVGDALRIAAEE
jgi:hypothetical protein